MSLELRDADLTDHESISAVIKDKFGRILVQEHAKHGFISIPMGKVENGMTVEETLKDELQSECGIIPKDYMLMDKREIPHTLKGINIIALHYMYEISSYEGEIKNCEPQKHPKQYFLSIEELSKESFISHVVQVFLELQGIKRELRID